MDRPRLRERLDRALTVPLTLVSAGAGYGKTTLVSSWIDSLAVGNGSHPRPPVAWISLDERDSDPDLFLSYFIAALRTIFPGSCAATLELLQGRQRPPQALLFATFSNELALLPNSFIVVLDDHQAILGSGVADLLSELVRHWPPTMHMVLISRHDPGLPLATLRAKGQMIEIRTRDLRFTPGEVAEYLERALPEPLGTAAVEALERRTEGWIAGLQLATVSLQAAEDREAALAALLSTDVDFAGYLADELLPRQPAPVATFLYQTAILDSFSAAVCDALVSTRDPKWSARRCIDWLERTNLFIVALDGRKEWYRYHHLFQSVLLQHAEAELGLECLAEMRARATAWFAGHGLVEEALRYALAANDVELTAELMEHGLCEVLNREDRTVVERWLRLLPEEFVHARPGLLMMKAWSLQFSWQLGQQAKVVQRAARLIDESACADDLPPEDLRALRGQVAALRGQHAYFDNDLEGALGYLEECLVLLPGSWLYVRGGAMLFLGLAMQAQGKGRDAERLLIEEYESLAVKTSIYGLRLLMALCLVHYAEAGDLEYIRQAAQRLAEEAESSRLGILSSWGRYLLGLVHYQRNELEPAEHNFAKVIEHQYAAQGATVRDGATRLALIYGLTGRRAEARRTAEFVSRLDVDRIGQETEKTTALRARLALLDGDLERATRWADGLSEGTPNRPLPWQDAPDAIRAQILVERGCPADADLALALLVPLQQLAERTHNARLMIEVLAVRSLALDVLGRSGEAAAALQAAVSLARPGGWVRPFVNLGPAMQEALRRLALQPTVPGATGPVPVETIRRLIAEFPGEAQGGSPGLETSAAAGQHPISRNVGAARSDPQPLIEPLTPRELEILELMREPLSMKEIARRLTISYETARRHAANIYGKLDANRRWAVVAKAEALGILPPR